MTRKSSWPTLFFVLLLVLLSMKSQATSTSPYILAARHLYNNYTMIKEYSYPRLVKKLDGFYLQYYAIGSDGSVDLLQLTEEAKVCDPQAHRFLPISIVPKGKTDVSLIDTQDVLLMDRMPTYGYAHAASDYIAYGRNRVLSAVDKYALARSYSAMGSAILNGSSGFSTPETLWTYDGRYPEETASAFLHYQDTTLRILEELATQDPAMDAWMVGSMRNKLSTELMYTFMSLCIAGNEEVAKPYLSKANYPGAIRQMAKSILQECPPNARLITYGDNDTYPLLYVQQKEGVRKDVVVINYSLLGLGEYANYLQRRKRIDFGFYFEAGAPSKLLYLHTSGVGAMPLQNFMATITARDGNESEAIDAGTVILPKGDSLPLKQLLYRNDIMVLALCHSERLKHPIAVLKGRIDETILAHWPAMKQENFWISYVEAALPSTAQQAPTLLTPLEDYVPWEPSSVNLRDSWLEDMYKSAFVSNKGLTEEEAALDETSGTRYAEKFWKLPSKVATEDLFVFFALRKGKHPQVALYENLLIRHLQQYGLGRNTNKMIMLEIVSYFQEKQNLSTPLYAALENL